MAAAELAQRFKTDGMLAYVETVQRKEKEIGCDVLTHQRWYALRSHPSVPFLILLHIVCCAGAEQTILIGYYPHLHPDHRVHRLRGGILPNTHSNRCNSSYRRVWLAMRIILSRDPE